jgi:glutathione synthase/RimK-type ligase-like ATP-grasp enzyme
MRIAVATSKDFPNLTGDDQSLVQPLQDRGIEATAAIWSDPNYDWAVCDMVVIRSCWDYHLRVTEFLSWIDSLETRQIKVWNSPSTIRWNADKIYLRELEAKGIAIVPTLWFDSAKRISLSDALCQAGWDKAVIKPRISATAHRTKLISIEQAEDAQTLFDELRNGPGVMVQKFIADITREGEWSLMFFDAKFSHAVLKIPKVGDFRVQHDFGGEEKLATPPAFVLKAAEDIIGLVPDSLYARVDGVVEDQTFLLMELELIEPALFLTNSPGAAEKLAAAIASR